eukprot:4307220-Amphidinium_carterae.1
MDARTLSTMGSWMASAAFGEPTPLPSPEDQAGAVVVVNSKQYVLGQRLGKGGGGSVFAATLKHKGRGCACCCDEEYSHDQEFMALKLVGGVGDAERRGADTRLAFVAVEAVAAAEVCTMAHNEVMRWQGRVFLPVPAGRVEAVDD